MEVSHKTHVKKFSVSFVFSFVPDEFGGVEVKTPATPLIQSLWQQFDKAC